MKIARFLLPAFFFPLVSFAQGLPGIDNPLTIEMSPTSPAPGETVSLTAESTSFNVNALPITWKSGGKVISSGTGDTTITIPSGAIGTKTVVTASTQVPSLGAFSYSVTISPALVNLIWEAQTSVPPFYQGKALPAWGGTYKVVAAPEVVENGKVVDPSRLVYTWKKNYSVDQSQSGYGKNVYQSDDEINYVNGGDVISLTVATTDGVSSAQNFISVSPQKSAILMYLESPLYGIMYNQSVTETSLSGDSITVHAEPFFFSDLSTALAALTWTVSGTSVQNFAGNPSITLVRQNSDAGTSLVDANIQSPTALLQSADGRITINTNAQK